MQPLSKPADTEDHRELPVSLDDLKEQLRIEHDEQDRLLLTKILAATNEAEAYTGSAIMARTFALVLPAFPGSSAFGIALRNPPVRSITSISYYDSDGNSQTLSSGNYYLLQSSAFPVIHLIPYEAWPDTQERENAVTVTYVAGHAAKPSAVPMAIREAVLLRAATRATMTEEAGTGTVAWKLADELAFTSLLAPFRNLHV